MFDPVTSLAEGSVNQLTTQTVAVVGEGIDGFTELVERYGVLATRMSEKRLLYMLAERDAGEPGEARAEGLFLFNLLSPFRYDWRDQIRRLRRVEPNAAIVVLFPRSTVESVDDAMRAGADEVLYQPELSSPRLVWQRIGGLIGPVPETSAAPEPAATESSRRGVLAITATDLRAPTGRLDATRVAKRLGVPVARLATVVGVSRQALSQTPDSAGIQAALEPIGRLLHLLHDAFSPDDTAKWLRACHKSLDGVSPLDAVMSGRADVVARLVETE